MKIFIILLCLSSMAVPKENLIIVANMNFPLSSLTASQLKQIYLKKVSYVAGLKLLPLNRLAGDSLRKDFEEDILHMSSVRLEKYWMNKHFNGGRPPLVKHSKKSIISFLFQIDGSLAYMLEEDFPIGLKILYRESKSSNTNEDRR